mgnify:CR=1 FL=1
MIEKLKKMKISELKPLEKNPFKSTGDEQIQKIADSIKSFERMLSIRKIIIDEDNSILGGNKRFFALKKLGYKDIPDEWIDRVTGLTEAEKREFIVKDNSHWGSEWDYEILTEWESPLIEWGVPELPDFAAGLDVNDMTDDDVDIDADFDPIGLSAGQQRVVFIFETAEDAETYLSKNKIEFVKRNMAWQVNMNTQSI